MSRGKHADEEATNGSPEDEGVLISMVGGVLQEVNQVECENGAQANEGSGPGISNHFSLGKTREVSTEGRKNIVAQNTEEVKQVPYRSRQKLPSLRWARPPPQHLLE